MVLRDRIADRGLSGSIFIFMKSEAFLSPSSSFIVIYEMGVDMRTDSKSEHRNEIPMVRSRYTISSVILYYTIICKFTDFCGILKGG